MTTKKQWLFNKRMQALKNNQKSLIEKESTKEERINELKGKIKLCEHDLEGEFKGNTNIQNKLDILKKQLKGFE